MDWILYDERTPQWIQSLKQKTFTCYLMEQIKSIRTMSPIEVYLLAVEVQSYWFGHLQIRSPGQIELPMETPEHETFYRLTVIADDDLEILDTYGIRAMQKSRMARLLEEAYFQGRPLDVGTLQFLIHLEDKTIKQKLNTFQELGCFLPSSSNQQPSGTIFRGALAIKRHLQGEPLIKIKNDLCFGDITWKQWLNSFQGLLSLQERDWETISSIINQPLPLLQQWQEIHEDFSKRQSPPSYLSERYAYPITASFREKLTEYHGLPRSIVDEFIAAMDTIARSLQNTDRKSGAIQYRGTSTRKRPFQKTSASSLLPCHLEYCGQEEKNLLHPQKTEPLKEARIHRLATQAYEQGAALTQTDLAFIMAISVEGVRHILHKSPQTFLPTRGLVTATGPNINQAIKIIHLWMEGYTEQEIMVKTGNNIKNIPSYLQDFYHVLLLHERGMPLPAIRKVMSTSISTVKRYVDLYTQYKTPAQKWRVKQLQHRIERYFEGQENDLTEGKET